MCGDSSTRPEREGAESGCSSLLSPTLNWVQIRAVSAGRSGSEGSLENSGTLTTPTFSSHTPDTSCAGAGGEGLVLAILVLCHPHLQACGSRLKRLWWSCVHGPEQSSGQNVAFNSSSHQAGTAQVMLASPYRLADVP